MSKRTTGRRERRPDLRFWGTLGVSSIFLIGALVLGALIKEANDWGELLLAVSVFGLAAVEMVDEPDDVTLIQRYVPWVALAGAAASLGLILSRTLP